MMLKFNMGIFYGIIYAILVSLGKTSLKKSLMNDVKSSTNFLFETIFGLFIWLPFGFIVGIDFDQIWNILPVVLLGAILSEAYIFYIYTKGDLSIIGTVFPTYSIYTIIFSYIFLNERLSFVEIVFVAITISGTIAIALPSKRLNIFKQMSPALWALSGAIAVGFADSLGKGVINDTSAATFMFVLGFVQIPVALIFMRLEKVKLTEPINIIKRVGDYKFLILSSFLLALAQLFFWLSFEGVRASIASPLTTSQAMFTIIFAVILLKEKVSFKNIIGILITLVGVMGIAFVQ